MILQRMGRKAVHILMLWVNGKKTHSMIHAYRNIDNIQLEGENIINKGCYLKNVSIGKFSYMGLDCRFKFAKIGRFTSIGANVRNVIGQHPTRDFVSSHFLFYSLRPYLGKRFVDEQKFEEYKYADENRHSVVIGNDVWIGENVLIMEGVTICDGAIIAAGAIVTKNVPPYAIVAGVPAKIIRYRFNKEEIDFLLDFRWWDKDEEWIKSHSHLFDDINKLRGYEYGEG